jgi:hypothetical protein
MSSVVNYSKNLKRININSSNKYKRKCFPTDSTKQHVKKHTQYKDTNWLNIKGWTKLYHCSTSQKKTEEVIVVLK